MSQRLAEGPSGSVAPGRAGRTKMTAGVPSLQTALGELMVILRRSPVVRFLTA